MKRKDNKTKSRNIPKAFGVLSIRTEKCFLMQCTIQTQMVKNMWLFQVSCPNLYLIFEQFFQGYRNRYNVIDRPNGSCIFCEKTKYLILAHLKYFHQFTKLFQNVKSWCLVQHNGKCCLIRYLFSKHIKNLFMSAMDKIMPVRLRLRFEF